MARHRRVDPRAAPVGPPEALIRSVRLRPPESDEDREGYPWALPAVAALAEGVELHPRITFLVGENGSGKSTLVEAIAAAAGMNPEGGSSGYSYATRESHSALADALTLVRGGRRPQTDFFLRAESLFTAATYLERLPLDPLQSYGGRSLHEQSHGESFLAVVLNRLGPNGLYLLDEPEAALSFQHQLTLLRRMDELARQGAQWIVATHSPVLVAHPDARILLCDEDGLTPIGFDDVPAVAGLRRFLADPARQLELLLGP